jgi:hypothetical protein
MHSEDSEFCWIIVALASFCIFSQLYHSTSSSACVNINFASRIGRLVVFLKRARSLLLEHGHAEFILKVYYLFITIQACRRQYPRNRARHQLGTKKDGHDQLVKLLFTNLCWVRQARHCVYYCE